MLVKRTTIYGSEVVIACDANCHKAWGMQTRPRHHLGKTKEDFSWLSDNETPQAPNDPKTRIGPYAKPLTPEQRLNSWCINECERIIFVGPNETRETPNWSKRIRNLTNEAK